MRTDASDGDNDENKGKETAQEISLKRVISQIMLIESNASHPSGSWPGERLPQTHAAMRQTRDKFPPDHPVSRFQGQTGNDIQVDAQHCILKPHSGNCIPRWGNQSQACDMGAWRMDARTTFGRGSTSSAITAAYSASLRENGLRRPPRAGELGRVS